MPGRYQIVDGTGRRYSAGVTKDHRLLVSAILVEEVNTGGADGGGLSESLKTLPFRQYLTTDGTASGVYDMRVNASLSAPQDFYIDATLQGDIYLTKISVVISDTSMTMAKFGTITALTNGVQLFFTSTKYGNIFIQDSLKTNFEFVRASNGVPGTGNASDAFIISSVSGNSDAILVNIDLAQLMPPYGVCLHYGSTQRFVCRIRDNVSGIDAFNMMAFGFIRLP